MLSKVKCKSCIVMMSLVMTVVFLLLSFLTVDSTAVADEDMETHSFEVEFQSLPEIRSNEYLKDTDFVTPNPEEDRFTVSRKVLKATEICRSGHMQGLKPICGVNPCLKKINHKPTSPTPRKDAIPADARRKINFMGGWLDSIHMSLVSHVTDMQWSHGIYGTVGEMGVNHGKFTSILSFNLDTSAGEKLFVADAFSSEPVKSSAFTMDQRPSFVQNMKEWNHFTSGDNSDPDIFVHNGNSFDMSAEQLQEWDLPQFRFFAIDGNDDPMSILHAIEKASCLLRDGGIVAIDGIHLKDSNTQSAVKHYFHRNGPSALTPLMSVKNKLYLCTADYKEKYVKYFIQHRDLLVSLNIKEVHSDTFGIQSSYFTTNR